MQSTKSEILLNRILKNVGLINTTPYLYASESNPYSTKTERILYLIELHTRGLGPLIDDLRLNREYYFDFQTTDYINFTVPYTCVLKEIVKSDTNANLTIVRVSNGASISVEEEIGEYTQIKMTSDIVTHVTLKVRLNDYI
jgi:hypothetical protein